MAATNLGPLDHIILFVPDVGAAVTEYTEKLGFRKLFGDDDNFTAVSTGDGPWIGLHRSETGQSGEPVIPYFRVSNIQDVMAALKDQGVKVGNFHEVPTGQIATAWDSGGNPLRLYEESGK